MSVRLVLRQALPAPCDGDAIRPDAFASLGEAEIARLPVPAALPLRLGDLFHVRGERSDDVQVEGDLRGVRRLGAGMAGGTLRVLGTAGDALGAGLRGGLVLVHGSAGHDAGLGMRRGTIAIAGDAGERAAARAVAGTLLVAGGLGHAAGVGLKRGSLVAGGSLALLPTFRLACTYRPVVLELLLRSLRRHGFEAAARLEAGAFRRWIGDCSELGRGEILEWVSP
jgi:formylmethanofuran dehydrogenase subunit C